jgi:glyoxylase-like metal-dependent hydrolase (beta-lactamase superfamily II)
MARINTFRSRHFNLEQLADGVYAAVNSRDGWAICNAGIIDLGDRTIVYDAFISPQAASDLRAAAEHLTNRPVHAVIDSHYHNDHIWGNQAFSAETDILSTEKTRELILTEGPKEIQGCQEVIQQRLESTQAQFSKEHSQFELDDLTLHLVYYQAIQASLPILEIRLPNITFSGDLTFEGSKRSARLITYDNVHCGNDAILVLPDDGIVFMEDILFSGFHPYLEEGNPENIQKVLAEAKKLGAKWYIPGHGPVGNASQLDWMDGYIQCLNSLAGEVIRKGGDQAELEKVAIPVEYQHLLFPQFFMINLKFLYLRQIPSGTGLVQ